MHDSIKNEIEKAKRIFDTHQKALSSSLVLTNQLKRYRTCIERTTRTMREIAMISGCTECAKKTGSCCFREVEKGYDHVLLLINLMIGVRLPQRREIKGNCYFLGKSGCKIVARDSFCINYICNDLKRSLGRSTVSAFSAIAGEEIFCGWETELAIGRWLATQVTPIDELM